MLGSVEPTASDRQLLQRGVGFCNTARERLDSLVCSSEGKYSKGLEAGEVLESACTGSTYSPHTEILDM